MMKYKYTHAGNLAVNLTFLALIIVFILAWALRVLDKDKIWHNILGTFYFKKNIYKAAFIHYKKALDLDPYYFETRNNLGKVYLMKREYSKAKDEFKESIRLNPGFLAHNKLANVYFQEGDLDLAIAEYAKALEYKPEDSDIYTNLGIAYYTKGDLPKAQESWITAIRLRRENKDAHNNLGVLYLRNGLYDKARIELEATLKIDPNHADAIKNMRLLEKIRVDGNANER